MIELILPFPPTVNSYYSHTRNGVFISKKGKVYRGATQAEVLAQLGGTFAPLEDSIYLEVLLTMPDRRKRDLDNYMKSLLDALTHAQLWLDDSQIDQLSIYRGPVSPPGSVTIRVYYPAGPIIKELVD